MAAKVKHDPVDLNDLVHPLKRILRFILDELLETEFKLETVYAELVFDTDKNNEVSVAINYYDSENLTIVINLTHSDKITYYETDGKDYYPLEQEYIEYDKVLITQFIKEFNDEYKDNTKYMLAKLFASKDYSYSPPSNTNIISLKPNSIQIKLKELWS